VYGTSDGPCYRCIHPEPPAPGTVADCATGGVLGVLPGILGAMQATEAIKLILGIGESVAGRLLVLDALAMRIHEVAIARDPACPWCATRTATALLDDYAAHCGEAPVGASAAPATASAPAASEATATPAAITPEQLAVRLSRGDRLLVLDVREGWEVEVGRIAESVHLPMAEVPRRHAELPREAEIVVVCHHGMRSAMVADYLRSAGFPRVLNLTGGIDRWSVAVDPAVARY
jgi:adenylyltransferase/sulfurtransferase